MYGMAMALGTCIHVALRHPGGRAEEPDHTEAPAAAAPGPPPAGHERRRRSGHRERDGQPAGLPVRRPDYFRS